MHSRTSESPLLANTTTESFSAPVLTGIDFDDGIPRGSTTGRSADTIGCTAARFAVRSGMLPPTTPLGLPGGDRTTTADPTEGCPRMRSTVKGWPRMRSSVCPSVSGGFGVCGFRSGGASSQRMTLYSGVSSNTRTAHQI